MELTEASEEEKVARDLLTHAPWGAPLDLDSWLRRERRLRAHPWSTAGMRTWFLREGGEVLSSCETFAMRSTAGSEAGTSYGVASVFTEERHRGRGHATELLRRVHARLSAGDRLAQAFILFSEVGAGIYERAGYAARREWDEDLVFPPSTATGLGAAELAPEEELARVLACAPPPPRGFAVDDLPRADDAREERLDKAAHPLADGARVVERPRGFLVWPSAEQLDWHRERERIYAEALGRPRAPGCGARHRDGVVIWTGNLRSNRLYVLLLRAETAEAASALVEAARRAAAAAGLGAVQLWNCPLPEGWSPESASGRLVPRDQALPMIHPLKPQVRAEDWTFIPRALWI